MGLLMFLCQIVKSLLVAVDFISVSQGKAENFVVLQVEFLLEVGVSPEDVLLQPIVL